MSDHSKNKIYWIEGVTRKEVQTALSTNKYPLLYRRSIRRALVSFSIALSLSLIFSSSIEGEKMSSYVSVVSGLLLIGTYLALRFSVRMIADAPTELLDERLIAIRDRTYLTAYRWLSFVVGIVFGAAIAGEFSFGVDRWGPVLVALALLIAGLPSMVLAWKLPSEVQASED